ncbi:MAG: hypothetical protein JNK85_23355 [Verrucomicrobiales bacterium]|nr:hypothetical protein [Verrucomicrobiales bacterium]
MKSPHCRFGMVAALSLFVAGCGEHDHDHDHGTAAGSGHHHGSAHGGVAVELGEHQFHLDFLHDATNGALTAWVMDAHVENFIRVSLRSLDVQIVTEGRTNAITLEAVANPATGESVGDTSMFRGTSDSLKGLTKFSGHVGPLEIRGVRLPAASFQYPAPSH